MFFAEPSPTILDQLRRATPLGLVDLGAVAGGRLTPAGVVTLASSSEAAPSWVGFRAATWPGALVDRPRLDRPIEIRRLVLPTLTFIDVLADEAAVALGERLPIAVFDGVREAAEELLVNAVAHRDYAVEAPIEVELFADALRIRSPGTPAHAEVSDGGFCGRGTRNPALQHLLRLLGRGRQQGLGWRRCVWLAAAAGLGVEAAVDRDLTVTTLAVRPDERVRVEAVGTAARERRLRLPSGTWDARVLGLLDDGQSWRPKDIQAALDIPRSTLTTVLRRLRERGDIEPGQLAARSSKQTWRRTHSSPRSSMPTRRQASNPASDGNGSSSAESSGSGAGG